MQQQDFSHLKDHFSFEVFDLNSAHRFSETLIEKAEKQFFHLEDFPFGIVFYEKETDFILYSLHSSSMDCNYEPFEFYLKQLPTLELSDVAYFFSLIDFKIPLQSKAFKFDELYPSEFSKEFLKDTYGNVVYTYQLMQLISFCLRPEERDFNLMNDYRRGYNKRLSKTFEKLKTLYLPDGYSLYELLRNYTPTKTSEFDKEFGFVCSPRHSLAYEFIQRAKKYI